MDFVERLCVKHLDPHQSDPDLIDELKEMSTRQYTSSDEVPPSYSNGTTTFSATQSTATADATMEDGSKSPNTEWKGIRKDAGVGIFTDEQWTFIMTKCLRAMGDFSSSRSIDGNKS